MADNLQEQLYQNLRAALLAGTFKPGERLKIRDLAAAWGTSPMPVRAALQRLVAEGALEQRDVQGYLTHNSRFHLTLYQACANPVLLRLIESLWLQVGPFFNRLFTEADLSLRLNDFHEDCLAAIERGEPAGARAAIEADLSYFGKFLLNLLDLEAGERPAR